ncbi:hypothetical protein CRG98_029751 [Punica granatum]|nr:hypothetical protein CRG98_029751 [Punica granatum]
MSDAPPGSCGLPLLGETVQFMAAIHRGRGFYDFVQSRRLRYGNCFKTNIFGITQVFLSSTASAKMILNNESGKFTKRYIRSIAELVGDHSILCASQQHHKLLRTCLGNLFSTASLSKFTRQFDESVVQSLEGWGDGDIVIILNEALEITFKAICGILIGLEDGDELKTLQKDIDCICKAMLALPLRLPWTRFRRGLQARERIMRTLETITSERRHRGISQDDFLQHLLALIEKAYCDVDLPRLTDGEIKDNILTMIIAGQDTTASAITWMVKYLGENQKALDILRAEQLHFAKRISPGSRLSLEDLSQMPYASKVVKESLRMASIVPWFPRLVLQDSKIEGYQLKRGWTVNVDARSIHLDPSVHTNPHEFNPSRFDDESKPYSFLAFGMGARTCLGTNMARAMMLVFLHRLVTSYEWEVMDSDSTLEKWAMFSRLKNGCPVMVKRLADHTTPV